MILWNGGLPVTGRTTLLGPGQVSDMENTTILCSSWPSTLTTSMKFLAWLYTGHGKSGQFLTYPPTYSILLSPHKGLNVKNCVSYWGRRGTGLAYTGESYFLKQGSYLKRKLVNSLKQHKTVCVCVCACQGHYGEEGDFIMIVPLLPSFHGFFCVFGCKLSFLVGWVFLTDGCSAISCEFGVFVKGYVLKFLLLHHCFQEAHFKKKKKHFLR